MIPIKRQSERLGEISRLFSQVSLSRIPAGRGIEFTEQALSRARLRASQHERAWSLS